MAEQDQERAYEVGRDDSGVTARERMVLDLLRSGASQAEVGRQLALSRARVGQIVNQLRRKRIDVSPVDGRVEANRARIQPPT